MPSDYGPSGPYVATPAGGEEVLVLCRLAGWVCRGFENFVDHRLIARIGGRKRPGLLSRTDKCKSAAKEGEG